MGDALLEVSNVETYYGPIMAIRGISFAVPRGQIVTILGANGAGKTTILKTVSGVMNAQKGSVTFDGRPIALGTAREVQDHPEVVKAYLGG